MHRCPPPRLRRIRQSVRVEVSLAAVSEDEAGVIGISGVGDAALFWMTGKASGREVARRTGGGIEIRETIVSVSESESVSSTGEMIGELMLGMRRESRLIGWIESVMPNAGSESKE